MSSVAVIDIGSNSIKLLVAAPAGDGTLTSQKYATIDARISAGISHAVPRLSEAGMARGLEAVQVLLAEAAAFAPATIVLVATSAVRDAQNGADFRERVRRATGHPIRLLSGDEEANLIGRGLTCDPALAGLRDFYVFDLGGGSLECLAFRDRTIKQAISLQLGCVRLTEKFVGRPEDPFTSGATAAITGYTRQVLLESKFEFSLPANAVTVGTGGTLTTTRAVLAAQGGQSLEQTSPQISVRQLRELLLLIGSRSLDERKTMTGLPPARADVFPAALATLIALAESGGFDRYYTSVYNLRWGMAADALANRNKA
jgi:exopolyphosphatase/guanosine-5'-triphosphate,3'-diphosphate pyrophosphatase